MIRESLADADLGFTLRAQTADAEAAALLVAVNILNGDVTSWYARTPKSATADTFANAWITWRDTFYGWYKLATEHWSNVAPPLPWTVSSDVEKKTGELSVWRKQFEQISGTAATGPDPTTIVAAAGGGSTPWWVWAGVAAAGAIGVLVVVKTIRGAVSPFGSAVRRRRLR